MKANLTLCDFVEVILDVIIYEAFQNDTFVYFKKVRGNIDSMLSFSP